jgi:hypothetical protein
MAQGQITTTRRPAITTRDTTRANQEPITTEPPTEPPRCPTGCPAGQSLFGRCTATTVPFCRRCSDGFFQPQDGSASRCSQCRVAVCGAGTQLTGECTSTTTPTCDRCPAGMFKTSSMPFCQAKRTCGLGQFRQARGDDEDAACFSCPQNTYQPFTDHTRTSCQPCLAQCPSGQSKTGLCAKGTNFKCDLCRSSCPSGQRLIGSCSASQPNLNSRCATCPYVPSTCNMFELAQMPFAPIYRSGTFKFSNTLCKPCTQCNCFSQQCSATSDAVCG